MRGHDHAAPSSSAFAAAASVSPIQKSTPCASAPLSAGIISRDHVPGDRLLGLAADEARQAEQERGQLAELEGLHLPAEELAVKGRRPPRCPER